MRPISQIREILNILGMALNIAEYSVLCAQHAKRPFVVGFAAETQNVEAYARGKLANKQLDMIACNDVSRSDIGFASDENAMHVFFSDRYGFEMVTLDKASKAEIARRLVDCIEQARRS